MLGKKKFENPDFSSGEIEVRYEDGEVCIYASASGLKDIISHCEALIKEQPGEHIHLEDYEVLTTKSLRLVMERFSSLNSG